MIYSFFFLNGQDFGGECAGSNMALPCNVEKRFCRSVVKNDKYTMLLAFQRALIAEGHLLRNQA
jgi:hypothetical protein